MTYENLLKDAEKDGIEVLENDRIGKLYGLCVNNTLTINSNIQTTTEKTCILAEELGHYHTSSGNILDQSKIENRKQERKARAWGYEKILPIQRFIDGYNDGARNRFELAEFLGVTEQFLLQALEHYKNKYGLYHKIDNYLIYFEPLAVIKMEV